MLPRWVGLRYLLIRAWRLWQWRWYRDWYSLPWIRSLRCLPWARFWHPYLWARNRASGRCSKAGDHLRCLVWPRSTKADLAESVLLLSISIDLGSFRKLTGALGKVDGGRHWLAVGIVYSPAQASGSASTQGGILTTTLCPDRHGHFRLVQGVALRLHQRRGHTVATGVSYATGNE